jgi:hypothetical protein
LAEPVAIGSAGALLVLLFVFLWKTESGRTSNGGAISTAAVSASSRSAELPGQRSRLRDRVARVEELEDHWTALADRKRP